MKRSSFIVIIALIIFSAVVFAGVIKVDVAPASLLEDLYSLLTQLWGQQDQIIQASGLSGVQVGITDPSITYQPGSYHSYKGCGSSTNCPNLLFVFLPGTDGYAKGYQKIVETMAGSGMAAIGLNYYNLGPSLDVICKGNDQCFEQARKDRFFGSGSSIYVPSKSDGIENRLLKLLQYLKWTNFYDANGIRYDRIIFGGHSQGAGMAAFIGKQKLVARVCQFAGAWDHLGENDLSTFTPASWISKQGATPGSRFYGFNHRDDAGAGSNQQNVSNTIPLLNKNWEALGMGTNWSLPLWNSPSGQKIMTTDNDCPGVAHTCPVVDGATPLNAYGSPRYVSTWKYVCGANLVNASLLPPPPSSATTCGTDGSVCASGLTFASTPVNGWGPVEKNMSNGETAQGDGRTITLNGTTYQKGLGAHAYSQITYNINKLYSFFPF